MFRRLCSVLVFLCSAGWAGACMADTSIPLTDFDNIPARLGNGKPASVGEIKTAFVKGARQGWTISDNGPNRLTARLDVRRHTLVMDVVIDEGSFSLKYRESAKLNEVDRGGVRYIHFRYESWNKNLQSDVQRELLRM